MRFSFTAKGNFPCAYRILSAHCFSLDLEIRLRESNHTIQLFQSIQAHQHPISFSSSLSSSSGVSIFRYRCERYLTNAMSDPPSPFALFGASIPTIRISPRNYGGGFFKIRRIAFRYRGESWSYMYLHASMRRRSSFVHTGAPLCLIQCTASHFHFLCRRLPESTRVCSIAWIP